MSEPEISPDEPDGVTDAEALGCTPIPNSNGKPPDGPTKYKGEDDSCRIYVTLRLISTYLYWYRESL